jgi:predicted HicB family RNase H-like nuclease
MISKVSKSRPLGRATRDVGIMLRVSADEHKVILQCAQSRGLSLSSWARMHLLEAVRHGEKKAGHQR